MGRPAGYQWQPLGLDSDPVPGDPAQISQEAQHLASVAAEITGSRDVRNAGSYGAGQPIDCGVTYTSPGSFGLSVSVGWTACWAPGTVAPGGPPADCNTNIPGAGGLQGSTVGPVTVNVREIQSVNNS